MTSESRNLYLPPNADINTHSGMNPADFGLVAGFLFASPLLLALIAALIKVGMSGFPGKEVVSALCALPIVIGLIVATGWWWGKFGWSITFWRAFILMLMQGICLLISFMSVVALTMSQYNNPMTFSYADIKPTLIAWAVCDLWIFALASLVRWRVRKLHRLIDTST